LRLGGADPTSWAVWNEPYLETCCRSALHRVALSGAAGRPPGLKDGRCLERLCAMGFVRRRADGRWGLTEAGAARHGAEILHVSPADLPPAR
jgi:hypothetical protein